MTALSIGSPATAVAECESDPDRLWLCEGDEAPYTGYLVDPLTMESIKATELKLEGEVAQAGTLITDQRALIGLQQEVVQGYKARLRQASKNENKAAWRGFLYGVVTGIGLAALGTLAFVIAY